MYGLIFKLNLDIFPIFILLFSVSLICFNVKITTIYWAELTDSYLEPDVVFDLILIIIIFLITFLLFVMFLFQLLPDMF